MYRNEIDEEKTKIEMRNQRIIEKDGSNARIRVELKGKKSNINKSS